MPSRRIALLLSAFGISGAANLMAAGFGFLYGSVEDNRYLSPSGEYSITLPMQIETGGSLVDTPEVVTLQNELGLHLSLKRQDENLGRRDFLAGFFRSQVQPQFTQRFKGSTIESARFSADLFGGALFVYNLLPGGSMFGDRAPAHEGRAPPIAKRGNLLFLHNNHIYVVSMELSEKVLDPDGFTATVEEQDAILQKRLMDLVGRMSFRVPLTGL